VSVLEVIGIFVVIPAVVVALVAVLTMGVGRRHAKTGYQPGQPWEHPDQFWAGDTPVVAAAPADRVGSAKGGARGSW
jgi:hypothetical protein